MVEGDGLTKRGAAVAFASVSGEETPYPQGDESPAPQRVACREAAFCVFCRGVWAGGAKQCSEPRALRQGPVAAQHLPHEQMVSRRRTRLFPSDCALHIRVWWVGVI